MTVRLPKVPQPFSPAADRGLKRALWRNRHYGLEAKLSVHNPDWYRYPPKKVNTAPVSTKRITGKTGETIRARCWARIPLGEGGGGEATSEEGNTNPKLQKEAIHQCFTLYVTQPTVRCSQTWTKDTTITPGSQCLKFGRELGSQERVCLGQRKLESEIPDYIHCYTTTPLGCIKTAGDVHMVVTWARDPFLRQSHH